MGESAEAELDGDCSVLTEKWLKRKEHPWTVTEDPRIQEESGLGGLPEVEHGDPLHHG